MCFLNIWTKKNVDQTFLSSSSFSLSIPSLLFHLSMLLLMSWWDVQLPWFQMFLIALLPGLACCYTPTCYSIMPHRAGHTHTHTQTRMHAYMHICAHVYKESMRAKWLSVRTKAAAASCTRRETSCCLAAKTVAGQPRLSTNQLCWGWMQEVSLTASRRKNPETLWGNTISSSEDKRGAGTELSHSYLSLSVSVTLVLSLLLQLLLS